MNVLKLLSVLLDYPGEDLRDWLDANEKRPGSTFEHIQAVDKENLLTNGEHAEIAVFVDHLRRTDFTELEVDYVITFDMTPEHSLHLTHHVFGDNQERGPALIGLSEIYKRFGLKHVENELPDYLPLMLEFASRLPPSEATVFLGDANKMLQTLADNLTRANSPYALLVSIVKELSTPFRMAA